MCGLAEEERLSSVDTTRRCQEEQERIAHTCASRRRGSAAAESSNSQMQKRKFLGFHTVIKRRRRLRFRCEIRLIFLHHIALPTHFYYGKPSLLNIRVSVEHIFKRSQRAIIEGFFT